MVVHHQYHMVFDICNLIFLYQHHMILYFLMAMVTYLLKNMTHQMIHPINRFIGMCNIYHIFQTFYN